MPGGAEVGELYVVVSSSSSSSSFGGGSEGEQDVGGLDIAVDDILGVQIGEGLEGLAEDGFRGRRRRRHGAFADQLCERQRHVGEDQDQAALGVLGGALELDDGWVAELREDLDLALRVVRLHVACLGDDLESEHLRAVDFGR